MGAADFMKIGRGSNATDAYHSLCRDAADEAGHSDDNGTISTTHGFFMASDDTLPVSVARRLGEVLIETDDERLDKWGDCACFPVASDSAFTARRVSISLDPASPPTDLRDVVALSTSIERALREQKLLKPGEDARCFSIARAHPWLYATVRTRAGKAVKRYVIVERNQFQQSPEVNFCAVFSPISKGFVTLSAARKALTKMVRRAPFAHESAERAYDIIGVVIREDGGGLITGARTAVEGAKPTVMVNVYSPKAQRAAPTDWLFVGLAAS